MSVSDRIARIVQWLVATFPGLLIVAKHTISAGGIVGLMEALHWWIFVTGHGHDPLLFDRVPLRYLFDAIETGVVAVFGYHAVIAAYHAFRE